MKVPTVRVREVAQQIRGVTFSKADSISEPQSDYVPVIRAGNIQDGNLDFADLLFVAQKRVSSKQRLRPDDVVITASSGSLATIGKAARVAGRQFEGTFGAFLKVLRPGRGIHSAYFAHYFQTTQYRRTVAALAAGANINNLKNEHLDELEIRLPSFEEQRRIAAILDHADALRTKRRQVLAHLDALTQSIFHDLFSLPSFPVRRLSDFIASQQIGLDRGAKSQHLDFQYDYVKMDAITRDGKLDLSGLTRVDADADEAAKYALVDGDLILNTRNSRELVGKTAVYRGSPRLYNNNLMRLRFNNELLPDYVHGYLWSKQGKQELDRRKSGTTSVFAIYAKSLATIELPIPPLDLQRQFAALLHEVRDQIAVRKQVLVADNELFASLQSRAFKGEL